MSFNNLQDESLRLKTLKVELVLQDGATLTIRNTAEPDDNAHFRPRVTITRKVGCATEVAILQYYDTKNKTQELVKKHGKPRLLKIQLIDSEADKGQQDKCTFEGKYIVQTYSKIPGTRKGIYSYSITASDVYSTVLANTRTNFRAAPQAGKEQHSTFDTFFKLLMASIDFKDGDAFEPKIKKVDTDVISAFKLDDSKSVLDNLYEMALNRGYMITYIGGKEIFYLHGFNKDAFKDLDVTFAEPKGDGSTKTSKFNIMHLKSDSSYDLVTSVQTLYNSGTDTYINKTEAKTLLKDILLNGSSDCLDSLIDTYGAERSRTADSPAKSSLKMVKNIVNSNRAEIWVPGSFEINNIPTIVNVKKIIEKQNEPDAIDNELSGKWFVTEVHYMVYDYKFFTLLSLNRADSPADANAALEEMKAKNGKKKITKEDLKPLIDKSIKEVGPQGKSSCKEYIELSRVFGNSQVDEAMDKYTEFKFNDKIYKTGIDIDFNGSHGDKTAPWCIEQIPDFAYVNPQELREVKCVKDYYNAVELSEGYGQDDLEYYTSGGNSYYRFGVASYGDTIKYLKGEKVSAFSKGYDGAQAGAGSFFLNWVGKNIETSIKGSGKDPSEYLTSTLYEKYAREFNEEYETPFIKSQIDMFNYFDKEAKENLSYLAYKDTPSTSVNSNASKALQQKQKESSLS